MQLSHYIPTFKYSDVQKKRKKFSNVSANKPVSRMVQVVTICCKPEIISFVFNYVTPDYLEVWVFKVQII